MMLLRLWLSGQNSANYVETMFIYTRHATRQIQKVRQKLFYSTAAELKEEKIKIGKWDINYLKVGRGSHNILCLPGALGTIWTDFKPQIEGFDRDKFTLVVWDPPGYGKSRPPDKEFNADFYEKDADYAHKFMKALKIPKYSILGWSDGGTTALIHAAKYPGVMVKLVAFATNSFLLPNELEWYNQLRDVNTWSQNMKKPMLEFYGEYLATYWSSWMDGMENIFKVNNGNICSHLLKDIKCPTFILYGEKDPMVDPVHASHFLTNISNARLHLYPEGKHNLHLKFADDFNKRVQQFLLK